jgi:ATP-dependent DNA helicase RecQ
VFVSTIHKAKGREFDTVYLLSPVPDGRDINDMRAYYVGLTRAKRNLYLVTNPPTEYLSISIALHMRDVWLDFFKGRKDIVLRLRSGDCLQYKDGYLLNENKTNVAALSASGKDKLKVWTDKDYEVTSAKVSYTLAWKPQDSETEYAVCLANIVLSKTDTEKENYIIS